MSLSGTVRGLHRFRIPIIVVWALCAASSAYFAATIPNVVSQDIKPPTTSKAFEAREFFSKWFPDASRITGYVVFTEDTSGHNLASSEAFLQFDRAFEYSSKHGGTLDFPKEGFNISDGADERVIFASYRSVEEGGLPPLVATQYLAPMNTSAFMSIAFREPASTTDAKEFATKLDKALTTLLDRYGLSPRITGAVFSQPNFVGEIAAAALQGVVIMFAIAVPIALFIFAVSLSSVRLLVLPVATLSVSLCMTFALLHAVASGSSVSSFAPGIASALCVTLSICYSYFMAASLRDVYRTVNTTAQSAIVHMMGTSGRLVVISSVAVCLGSLGMVFFPIDMLRTIGLCGVFGSLLTMLACCTLVPCLLLTFPFFTAALPEANGAGEKAVETAVRSSGMRRSHFDDTHPSRADGRMSFAEVQLKSKGTATTSSSTLQGILEVAISRPTNIVIVVVLLALSGALCFFAFDVEYSNQVTEFVPRTSNLAIEWERMKKVFRAGEVFQTFLLVEMGDTWQSEEGFRLTHEMIYLMADRLPDTKVSYFDGITFDGVQSSLPNGGNVTYSEFQGCFLTPFTPECLYRFVTFGEFNGQPVPQTNKFLYFLFRPRWDPTTKKGRDWYLAARYLFPEIKSRYNISCRLWGYGPDTVDAVDYAEKSLPIIIAFQIPIIFAVVALAFGSILVAFRCICTVALSLGVTFGLTNLVYVHRGLQAIHFDGVDGDGAVGWMVPLAAMTLVGGLALSYDLVAVISVLEFRLLGQSTPEALLHGGVVRGKELSISTAVMATVFASLLFNGVPAMNQLGFMLIVATIVQGLVYRLLLTPALMSIFGDWNWFPRDPAGVHRAPLVLVATTADGEKLHDSGSDSSDSAMFLPLSEQNSGQGNQSYSAIP